MYIYTHVHVSIYINNVLGDFISPIGIHCNDAMIHPRFEDRFAFLLGAEVCIRTMEDVALVDHPGVYIVHKNGDHPNGDLHL